MLTNFIFNLPFAAERVVRASRLLKFPRLFHGNILGQNSPAVGLLSLLLPLSSGPTPPYGRPACQERGPSKIKRWLFSIQAIVTRPQTVTPPPPYHPATPHPSTPHPSTTRAYNLDASETRDPCLLPRCISYTGQGFGSRTRDSASHVTICQPPHIPTPTTAPPSATAILPSPTSSSPQHV